jgi:hypothetical protein
MEVEFEISWDDLVSIEPLGNVALRVLNLVLEVMKVLSDNIPLKAVFRIRIRMCLGLKIR